ncbi:MAG TPA: nucleotide-diphospho-sugar transferase [Bacteroidales bacterium]|nr:nucleotide-diphospho-sugar transferase [Bacteroidales bacterium]HOH22919.1 nucleotide-diphospho-sugar transferase [Bacteroidales bacterium]HPZ04190.1 nucleotide-diphospho-sugar transferase [Bacteroidales bacterium]HQB75613.1 nucleotide-diphospho-sugar transferase [Bacteroidales bacterium]HQQ20610.1 nucleotide-diphospho-sugar transferase [Bacteroidales bacterium]
MAFDIPVLFVIFNRPDTTERVFQEIRKRQPKYLYVAADGPRLNRPDDIVKCEETRAVIKQVDWDCELKLLFREENLGCGPAVSGAITWFFDQVEMGIVLEDDCLPHPDFFPYCQELLLKYKDVDQVKWISGSNINVKDKNLDSSYYFSAYNHVWGWASWKRVWQDYHYDLNDFDKKEVYAKIDNYFDSLGARCYWKNRFLIIRSKKVALKRGINTWDYQATFSIWMKDGLTILPQNNLIKNIGFGEDATHISTTDLVFETEPILPLKHNEEIAQYKILDLKCYKEAFYKPLWKYPLLYVKYLIDLLF